MRVPCFSSKFRLIFRTKIKKQIEGTIENSTSFQNLFFFPKQLSFSGDKVKIFTPIIFFRGDRYQIPPKNNTAEDERVAERMASLKLEKKEFEKVRHDQLLSMDGAIVNICDFLSF